MIQIDSPRLLTEHARRLLKLELELAQREVREKLRTLGKTAALGIGALFFAVVAVLLAIGAAVAGLTTVVDVWVAMLIVCGALALLAALLGMAARSALKRALPPVPTQAIEEARKTVDVLTARNGHGR